MIGGNKISGFVITYNEEANIRDCLESLKWVDELVVVDSYSQDRTLEIAREYTDRIITRNFHGYVDQARFAARQTTMPWVMWLDADERLSQEALDEIYGFFCGPDCERYAGMAFPRKTYFMDRWITHSGWYPQRKLRLFHRDRCELGGREPSSEVVPHGKVKRARGDILHLSYQGGIRDMVAATNNYTSRAANERFEEGRSFRLCKLLLEPPYEFLRKYLLQRGFLDGLPGLVIAAGSAYYRFVREAKLWELEHGKPPPRFHAPTMKENTKQPDHPEGGRRSPA